MRNQVARLSMCLALGLLLFGGGVPVAEAAPDNATVTLDFNDQTNQVTVTIDSPVGIGLVEMTLDIPTDIQVVASKPSGFLTGAEKETSDTTKHSWVQVAASGEKQGSLVITVAAGSSGTVQLTKLYLDDEDGNNVGVVGTLPRSVKLDGGGVTPDEDGPVTGGATVDLTFDRQTGELLVSIDSPSGITQAEVGLDIPADVAVAEYEVAGFLSDATYTLEDTMHTWSKTPAGGATEGSVKLTIMVPGEVTRIITLRQIELKGTGGSEVSLAIQLPFAIQVMPPEPVEDVDETELPKLLPVALGLAGAVLVAALVISRRMTRRPGARRRA